jgi:hypothetical protein
MWLRRTSGMRFGSALAKVIAVLALLAVFAGGCLIRAQEPPAPPAAPPAQQLPDKPEPATPQADSSSQAQQAPTESDRQKAEEQLKEQKKQRLLGIVPMFNTSYVSDAVSLTGGEKIKLAFRTMIDPVSFAGPAVVAGLGEINAPANNNGFGWGAEGYMKKWGAAYLDSFNGTMIGSGFLPALLRQDPRYFRLGHGTVMRRTFYSISTVVICKHDKTGKWEPNYSNVGGNFAAGALSTLYYPSGSDRGGWEQTITSAMIVTATGAAGSMFQEFWPDLSRKFLKKDPTHGRDAQIKAADQETKDKAKQPLPPSPK